MEGENQKKEKQNFQMVDGNTFIEIENGVKTETEIHPDQRDGRARMIDMDEEIKDKDTKSISTRLPGWVYKGLRQIAHDSNSSISSAVSTTLACFFNNESGKDFDNSTSGSKKVISINLPVDIMNTFIEKAKKANKKVSNILSSYLMDLANTGFVCEDALCKEGTVKIKFSLEEVNLLKKLVVKGIVKSRGK